MYTSNYDKNPQIIIKDIDQPAVTGWKAIAGTIDREVIARNQKKTIIAVETYPGTADREVLGAFLAGSDPALCIRAENLYKSEEEINRITFPDVTDDRIFGYMTRLTIIDFLDKDKLEQARKNLDEVEKGTVLLYGCGASEISSDIDIFIYSDLTRFEIQQRMRRKELANLGTADYELEISRKYKRAFFVDWRVADRIKIKTCSKWDFVLDTNKADAPVMITAGMFMNAMEISARRPFRLVPFFDPGPWGGQWMKEVCDLDRSAVNYAWCFDCVPEENSLLYNLNGTIFETPAINLVFFQPVALLGERVFARFGAEFPIRFDFLDTMGGGNLSLQVHPTTEYIREQFGMSYTQDESYYLLDAGKDARVYLGLREDAVPGDMIRELNAAQKEGTAFDADKYVAGWPARKHDHFLIPAGTVHCSGSDCMVLEISATPYIFTFKLWDWGRPGLDGMPRPINIEHGERVIQWNRTESWVRKELVNRITPVNTKDGCREERTGMHEFEFIETIRHWFSKKVVHSCEDSVNVLNLVEGREAIIESPSGAFEPFVVHYAETFVIPAGVQEYTIRPYGEAGNKECATIKAFIRR